MQKVVTLTVNPTIDKSTTVDSVASEIKLRCTMPTFDPGGGGINVSRAIKKLGGESVAVYTQGGGPGDMLFKLLAEEEITQHPVPIAGMTRENLTVFEETTTLQYRFGMPGPLLSEGEMEACIQATVALEADFIVASGSLSSEMPVDYYARLAERVNGKGGKLIVDTSGPALGALVNKHVFLLKPNLHELQLLTGEEFTGERRLKETAQAYIRSGLSEVLVISMGSGGALLVTADDYIEMRPPVVPIKSKVGAGDSMVGGIVWALAQGRDLADAMRYGVAAGSAAVMTPGTELCRKEDVEDIYPQVKRV
ncbi:1-phosphofructokinase family hexose kinase [Phototrophicus methaneseepsis]|uniref:1-phosphofructokinase family hexose kinase n=1 Tax=Phototrophicus methaneseepsis TaxID=2710758 RepID=A0A7S8EA71_9CHLR|nr:1-phosphofructokinase family hexose kinase [Phototrophicus methaneseepsis]QPC83201.1 1-phosphofructokinase family hexose kinase [Phototrophicus methaneseepsis]